ncbi:hypothetical protein ETB97_004200 [Aspergillus alliaceus]|uniref:Uncharacterized protein n=1 Tax=Petromyces alliaceus TaxID=209559 RepID=A0A8H6EB53_PETAA|nr:hypothetical protein ETB97_004200 [Aspergillus burnettii]
MDLVRAVVDSAQVFCDILREKVGSGLSYLDDLTTRLTMDIILRVILDMDLDYQRSDNEIHPEVMVQMQEEHNRLFGADPSAAVLRLKKQPSRSDQCSYTLAVIKETLRLFLPAATMRQGRSGVSLTDRHGNVYPTENVGTTILHPVVHLNSRVWPRVNELLPERFLVDAEHDLYPDPAAYRPFE